MFNKNNRILKIIFEKKRKKNGIIYYKKYFIIFLNILWFFLNIYFLYKYIKVINFKNVDKISLFFFSGMYKNISNYIISRYFLKLNNNYSSNNKKIILIDCVDFLYNRKTCLNIFNNMFKNINYSFKLNANNPDYVVYDVFGCDHNKPKYKNAIKIAHYSENILPDFYEADYAISQAHINYLDRYFKYPSFIWNLNKLYKYNFRKRRNEFLNNLNKTKFCAAVISNNHSFASFRLNFIKKLNKYKKVDMGGYAFNNVGGKVLNKIDFLSSYKFSIAMENSEGDGYISEKIIDSFIAGTIPIYYGNYMLDEYINPKAYILIKGEKDIEKKIKYIKMIDSDNELYKSILKEKIFLYDDLRKITGREYNLFFYNIFSQDKMLSKRKDDYIYSKC